jgi:hypothetical protein
VVAYNGLAHPAFRALVGVIGLKLLLGPEDDTLAMWLIQRLSERDFVRGECVSLRARGTASASLPRVEPHDLASFGAASV